MKGISCEMGMPFLMIAHIKPPLFRLRFLSQYKFSIDQTTDQKGSDMAKPNYQFKKRQKELAKKKKKEEKKQRKLEKKVTENDETEKDPSTADR